MALNQTDEQLANMNQSDLLDLRTQVTSQEDQNKVAGYEHRAFAREQVAENPLNAAGMAVAIPAYYVAKKTGITSGRSEASVDQMAQGYKGIAEGLEKAVVPPWRTIWNKIEEAVTEKAPEIASKLPWEQIYTKPLPEPEKLAVAPSKPVPAPSKDKSIDEVFNNLIKQESAGKHLDVNGNLIKSSAGAEGITQLMPRTAQNPGFGIEPVKDKSEKEYLRVGKEILSKLYEKFGNWEQALAAYNSGLGNVNKAIGKSERFGGNWKEYLPRKGETLPYINNILGIKEANASESK